MRTVDIYYYDWGESRFALPTENNFNPNYSASKSSLSLTDSVGRKHV